MKSLDPNKKYRFRMNPLLRWSIPAKVVERDGKQYFDRGYGKELIEVSDDMEIKGYDGNKEPRDAQGK